MLHGHGLRSKLVTALAAATMLLSVSACASSGSGSVSCAGFKPIILTDQSIDAMALEDLRQIEDHNDAWLDLCRG